MHEEKYLRGTNPGERSGFGRHDRDWERYRRVVTGVSTVFIRFVGPLRRLRLGGENSMSGAPLIRRRSSCRDSPDAAPKFLG